MQPRALQAGPDPAATHSAAPPSPSGRELASGEAWQLIELLGNGGSSQVWRATDISGRVSGSAPGRASGRAPSRDIALKFSAARLGPGASVALLAREHALLAQLAHEHVVATFGLVEQRGVTALALEYLPGGDLVALAGAHPRHWIEAARAVHAALAHLHGHGFVHRDVKARNVLFGADGRARLIDFASALPRGAPAPRGGTTAAHCAARRAGASVDVFDDAYAFAVLLYELFAGRLPHGVDGRAGAASGSPTAWPLGVDLDAGAAALATTVLEVLRADDAGLSAFADVLESAAAAYR